MSDSRERETTVGAVDCREQVEWAYEMLALDDDVLDEDTWRFALRVIQDATQMCDCSEVCEAFATASATADATQDRGPSGSSVSGDT